MTREEKVKKRKERKMRRIAKRNANFPSVLSRKISVGLSVGEARQTLRRGYFIDSSGNQMQECSYDAWGTCSYPCNGDC